MRPVRPSAKAMIIQDNQLLVIAKRDPEGVYYILPGGGQEPGESLPEALRRECIEEVAAEVEVGPLRFVRDYIGRNHEYAGSDGQAHNLDLMFLCQLRPGSVPAQGEIPDDHQFGIAWLPLDRLIEYRLYPMALRPLLADIERYDGPVYLGDVN
jgi:8-oxo-dGTP diphosphatase